MDGALPVSTKHKPLASTWLFWLALCVPILLGVLLAVLIGVSSDLGSVCFKSECVQDFFNVFKFPVAIMGLSLPLVAMVAAIHRSHEASLQIKISSNQFDEAVKNNRFGNYLKHREGFEKLIDGYCAKTHYGEKCKILIRKYDLYGSLFPGSGFNNVNWSGQCSEMRFDAGNVCAKVIMRLAQVPRGDFDARMFVECVDTLHKVFHVNYSPFKILEVGSDSVGYKQQVKIPGFCSDTEGVVLAASDCLTMLALFRSYVGENNSDDLMIDRHLDNLSENFRGLPSKVVMSGEF